MIIIGDGRDTGVVCKGGERERFGDDTRAEQFKAAGHGVLRFSKR